MSSLEPDPRAAFVAGAEWWEATAPTLHEERPWCGLALSVEDEAERRYPGGGPDADPRPADGAWPPDYIGRAFVEGAKWQEWEAEGATMWRSDERVAEEVAEERYPADTGAAGLHGAAVAR